MPRIIVFALFVIFIIFIIIQGGVYNKISHHRAIVEYMENKCVQAYPEQIIEFDFEYARTLKGEFTRSPLITDTVINADITIDCKEINNWKNRDSKKTRTMKQRNNDSEFTVCLESEKYSQDCAEIELTNKRVVSQSLFDLCEDGDTILLKEVDSSEVVKLSCE